jgi:hypothetical protein
MVESTPPVSSPEPSPQAWYEIWLYALIHPSTGTFQTIAAHPNATAGRAHIWVAAATAGGYVVAIVVGIPLQSVLGLAGGQSAASSVTTAVTGSLGGIFCILPFGILFSVGLFALGTFVTQRIAVASGGTCSYSKLAYVFASYAAPVTFIILASNALWLVGYCIALPVSIYGMVLSVIAVQGAARIGTGSAMLATVGRIVAEIVVTFTFACSLFFLIGLSVSALTSAVR